MDFVSSNSAGQIVDMWNSEENDYDLDSNTCSSGACLNYKQVWLKVENRQPKILDQEHSNFQFLLLLCSTQIVIRLYDF